MVRQVSFATFNLYNLQVTNGHVYGKKVKKADYDDKIQWSSWMLAEAQPDVIAFQELWAKECLETLFVEAGLRSSYSLHYIGEEWGGISVAAAVRKPWKVVDQKIHKAFPDDFILLKRKRTRSDDRDRLDDEIEVDIDRFTRTILQLTLKHKNWRVPQIEVFCVHLKAKLPTALDSEEKNRPEIMKNAGSLEAAISTIKRTAEAAALRILLNDIMDDNKKPVVVMGDFNDGLLSNTLSIITGQPPYQLFQAKHVSMSQTSIQKRDRGLHSTAMLQQYHSLRDVGYSHNYEGVLETLDHILVSEQFYDHSPRVC